MINVMKIIYFCKLFMFHYFDQLLARDQISFYFQVRNETSYKTIFTINSLPWSPSL